MKEMRLVETASVGNDDVKGRRMEEDGTRERFCLDAERQAACCWNRASRTTQQLVAVTRF